jgi:Domain of unknown function (DUF4407)
MGRVLIWLSGASPRILVRCPTERPKYLGIGAALAITAIIASVSMTFALNADLVTSLPVAIVFAAAWGFAIMSLDRWLIVSLQRQPEPWRYLILIIPRILLALLFGFVISTPFILQIFRPEIDQQITNIHVRNTNAYFSLLSTDALTQNVDRDQAAVSNLTAIIGTGASSAVNPFANPTLEGLVKQLNQDETREQSAFKQWQCQLYGVPVGSCKKGNGPLAAASHTDYLNAMVAVKHDNSAVQSLETQLQASEAATREMRVAQARAALPAAEQALAAARSEQSAQTDSFVTSNRDDVGLLIRLQALDEYAATSSTLNAARWLLFALFTMIEILPILVKVLLNLGPENTYEKILSLEEEMILRAAREDVLRRQAARSLE